MSAIAQLEAIAVVAGIEREFAAHLDRTFKVLTPAVAEVVFARVIQHVSAEWRFLDLMAQQPIFLGLMLPEDSAALDCELANKKLQIFWDGCLLLYPNNCALAD